MKRTFAFLLATTMLLALLPTIALAETSGTWGGIDWTLSDDGTLTIAPTAGTPVPDANCGKTYEVGAWREAVRYDSTGEGVAIEGWPYDRTKVKKLIIEEGVTSIGSFSAQGFTNLTGEVVIPSTVTYIGQEAFQKSTFTTLTFAEGGTEELCIAQGAFKNLIIETVALPADRPVHIHAWIFNNCHNLMSATIPASITSVIGTNHIDYFKDFNAHSNPTWTTSSEIFAYDENLETITFGSEEARDMFFANNNATGKDYVVAYSGLVAYASLQDAIDAAAEGDGDVTLLKSITVAADETITVPKGVTINVPTGKTLTNKGTIIIISTGDIEGTLTNVDNGVVLYAYEVSFVADGETVASSIVFSGEDAEVPAVPEKSGYTASWDHDGTNITADTVITAIYTAIATPTPEATATPGPTVTSTPEAVSESVPKTGDNTNLLLLATLVIASMFGIVTLKKREQC